MFQRCAVMCALGLTAILAGCRESGVQSCLDLMAAEQYREAAERCGQVYTAERDPRAGAAAARAHYFLDQRDKALAWVERLKKDGKIQPGVWSLAAMIHERQGEVEIAEKEYRSDLALHRAASNHRLMADALIRLFSLYWQQTRYREAFLCASEALEKAAKAQDELLKARSAEALYTVLYEVGDHEGARRALETARGAVGEDDLKGRARLLANRGILLFDEGRPALARRDFEKALELGAGSADEFFRRVHLNLTETCLALGETGQAARHLEAAWRHAEPDDPEATSLLYYRARVEFARSRFEPAAQALTKALNADPIPEWAWDLQYRRGLLEEARGNLLAAEEAYGKSIEIVEDMRRSLSFDELKTWLLDKKRQPFESLFRLQARSGRAIDALATAERAQARTFLDVFLHDSSAAGLPSSRPWSSGASLERMEALESLLPAMNESPVAVPRPISQVLSAFEGRDGLVYFEAEDGLWLIVVAGRRVRLQALAAPAAEVRRLGDRFLAHPEDAGTAERLGQILLPPASLPVKGRAIYVVADGMLGKLPFAALRREGRYLVEDHAVVFIPSLSALATLEDRRAGMPGPPRVLADPLGDLPAAAAEGTAVAKILATTVQAKGQATSGELAKASRARTLHLATHTGLGPRGPWLQLADRRVSAAEIVAGRIGPPTVVLASCASGVRTGRQMWGSLGASFLAAGSRAVVASLWSLDDQPAREFILRFYAERGADDPAGALARAQRVAIRRGESPIHWAPFVVFGSDRPLNEAL